MKNQLIRLLAIAGPLVVLDQVTKFFLVRSVALWKTVPVIPGFFNISHVRNTGGAFGLGADAAGDWRVLLFLVVSACAVTLVLWFYFKTPETHPWFSGGLALVFSGAAGNMIDRVRLGHVVDFLDFHIKGYHWPSFNVADMAITVGVGILILQFLLKKEPF